MCAAQIKTWYKKVGFDSFKKKYDKTSAVLLALLCQ